MAARPIMSRPISPSRFVAEFDVLWGRALVKRAPKPRIHFETRLDVLNDRNPRRYAETDVRRRIFCFAPRVLFLARPYRVALIAHEIGHVIMGPVPHTEDDANCAAFDDLSVFIRYDRRNFPGRGLQCASRTSLRNLPR